ncbi:MAG: CopG family transcriptional regulator [Clostridia bacterium]|jgi:putative iron-only hydrogenase system regulator|nr:CopG family transcriptional regulator [Clostridia bacterium]
MEKAREEERIGFIGIVIEDLTQAGRVNQIISQYQEMITGRIGVPDHERSMAVIGLLIRGDNTQVGMFTGKLGNIPGVQVKSAMTKSKKEGENGQ